MSYTKEEKEVIKEQKRIRTEDLFETLDDAKETMMDRYGMSEADALEMFHEYILANK